MVSKVYCVAITGVDTQPVTVETDVCNGLPSFDMVGLLGSDVKEARERVRTAMKNSGFVLPPKRITINFSPGNMRKSGTYFDLPVAVSILLSLGMCQCDVSDKLFVGELSLNGDVVRVNGVLPIVLCAMAQGRRYCFVPEDNLKECSTLEGVQIIGIKNLNQLVMILQEGSYDKHIQKNDEALQAQRSYPYDFCNIKGQVQARKGAEIAAAGMHNFLMSGPPGTGKSIVAKAMPSILPEMSGAEQLEISRIQSIAGQLSDGLVQQRPFRSPHHTVTVAAMIGGGTNPKPGEMTLAHGGVLYMDEFPEFPRSIIETLRQPLEEGEVVVARNGGTYVFPADFMLLVAMNPCRCGYYPDRNRCNCTEREVKKYLEKVSGPILDRMDLCVHLHPVSFYDLQDAEVPEDSAVIHGRVNRAVEIQKERYAGETFRFNSQLKGKEIEKYCPLGAQEEQLMRQIYEQFQLSIRAYEKIIKVARTIADLKGSERITEEDIAEAVSFRTTGWM